MGKIRTHASHTFWSDYEVTTLQAHYHEAPLDELERLLPGRHRRMIQCKANGLGLVRYRPPKRSPGETREAKRLHMARRRVADPEAVRAYGRLDHARNRDKHNAKLRELHGRRLFWSRSTKIKGIGPQDLAAIWRRQKGLCALTGRKMDRSAQVDHILPKARGGSDDLSNLQWVCKEANIAKRHMTDAEFVALCSDVMNWIGRRIQLVEDLPR